MSNIGERMKLSWFSFFVCVLVTIPVLADGFVGNGLGAENIHGQDVDLAQIISYIRTGESGLTGANSVGLELNGVSGGYAASASYEHYSTSKNKRILRIVTLGLSAASFGTSFYLYNRSNYYYDQYLTATQIDEIQQYFSLAQTPRYYSGVFLGLGIVILGYTVFDYFLTTDVISFEALIDRLENYDSKTVGLCLDGIRVRF